MAVVRIVKRKVVAKKKPVAGKKKKVVRIKKSIAKSNINKNNIKISLGGEGTASGGSGATSSSAGGGGSSVGPTVIYPPQMQTPSESMNASRLPTPVVTETTTATLQPTAPTVVASRPSSPVSWRNWWSRPDTPGASTTISYDRSEVYVPDSASVISKELQAPQDTIMRIDNSTQTVSSAPVTTTVGTQAGVRTSDSSAQVMPDTRNNGVNTDEPITRGTSTQAPYRRARSTQASPLSFTGGTQTDSDGASSLQRQAQVPQPRGLLRIEAGDVEMSQAPELSTTERRIGALEALFNRRQTPVTSIPASIPVEVMQQQPVVYEVPDADRVGQAPPKRRLLGPDEDRPLLTAPDQETSNALVMRSDGTVVTRENMFV